MKESDTMQLRFELGDSQSPRGHAILYAHAGNADRYIATYCVVAPITFSIGKFLPPILSGQLSMGGLPDVSATSVLPIPPILEDVDGLATLRQMAERRGDDLCDLGNIFTADDAQRMSYAAEACQSYGELYAAYQARWPAVSTTTVEATPLDDLDVDDVMTQVMPERDRLGELARLIGQARYAAEGHDRSALDDVTRRLRRLARSLPEKYRAEQLVDAALRDDATGAQLAQLYLQRAYKLLDEDYAGIPPIERDIRQALGEEPPAP
jgi:hypothetical protein